MSNAFSWPGSKWWLLDLHTHTPASHDFGSAEDRAAPDWTRWVEFVRDAGIDAVAVTDHNTAAGIGPIQEAAAGLEGAPVVFPGVELTAADGSHILAIFDPSRTQAHVEDLLSKADVPVGQRGQQDARSPSSVEQILGLDCQAVFIGAHINGPSGLLEHDGQQRINELHNLRLAAVELAPLPSELGEDDRACWRDPQSDEVKSWIDGSRPEIGRGIPQVACSDAHRFTDLGRRRTWFKMSSPNLAGLRLALLDGDMSLWPEFCGAIPNPNAHASHAIESISVRGAKYIGRRDAQEIRFNPWLNAIIGGRGTGKSTLIDLCRRTLRRVDELGRSETSTLRQAFDARMNVYVSRADEGLLTSSTAVEVVYLKDGERFVLAWDQRGQSEPITRIEGDLRVPEDGNVAERFPVRLYSQKQLFELARQPNALLTVIDDSPEVRGAELERRCREAEARYLAHRAEARALREQSGELAARRAVLGDVQRKINVLSQGDHAAVLGQYRARRQRDAAWAAVLQAAEDGAATIETAAREVVIPELVVPEQEEDDAAAAALLRADAQLRAHVQALREEVMRAVEGARSQRDRVLQGKDVEMWRTAVTATEVAYATVGEQLGAAGIASPDEYGKLIEQAETIAGEITDLERHLEDATELEAKAAAELTLFRDARAVLSERRRSFSEQTSSAVVKIEIQSHAVHDELEGCIRAALGIQSFDADHTALVERIRPQPGEEWSFDGLDRLVEDLRGVIGDPERSWPTRDRRFATALRRLTPERLDRVALYLPADSVAVSFRDSQDAPWKRLAQGSPGQQTAALLTFVLGYGSEPIILDQPEDDLDTTLIYRLVVRRLRETKPTRQIIVVTHNPNIVVHGDAELVVSLEARGGQTQIGFHGGLQEAQGRDEICRVMEGGRDAFETRYRRIMHPGIDLDG